MIIGLEKAVFMCFTSNLCTGHYAIPIKIHRKMAIRKCGVEII